MALHDIFRLISILGSLFVGFWLPLRLAGFEPPFWINVIFYLSISALSALNLYQDFHDKEKSWKDWKSWIDVGVVLDLICLFPLSLIYFLANGELSIPLLLLNLGCVRHIKKLRRFLDLFDQLDPTIFRLLPVFITLPLLVHLVACGWVALGSGAAGPDIDLAHTYVKAVYWAFTTLTTVGYGDIAAKTIPQMLYCCFVQVMGVGVFGYIVSNVANLLHRSDAAREHHIDSVDKIETFLSLHRISPKMRQKVRTYFHYLWTHKKGYQERSLLDSLPGKIQSELFFEINQSMVKKIDFLKDSSQELIEDLMLQLEPHIYTPGERIFRIDEAGDGLFFIHSGQVEIRGREDNLIVTLHEGQFFGEMALINNENRSATARAVGFAELYVLHKDSFNRVMQTYPEFKKHIDDIAQRRNQQRQTPPPA